METATQLALAAKRSLIRAADLAFVNQALPTPPAVQPAPGLLNVAGIVEADAEVEIDLDPVINLVAQLEENDAHPTGIIISPSGWAALRRIKVAETFNQMLLGAGTDDAEARLLGIPLTINNAVPAGKALVVDKSAIVAAHGGVEIQVFDQVPRYGQQLRAVWRIGHAVVRPERIGVFTIAN